MATGGRCNRSRAGPDSRLAFDGPLGQAESLRSRITFHESDGRANSTESPCSWNAVRVSGFTRFGSSSCVQRVRVAVGQDQVLHHPIAGKGAEPDTESHLLVLVTVDREDDQLLGIRIVGRHRIHDRGLTVLRTRVARGSDLHAQHVAGGVPGGLGEGVEGRLPPRGPAGLGRIGAITLTSWAWQAAVTRSLCRSRVISREPTTTASATV